MILSVPYLWSVLAVGLVASAVAASNESLHIDSTQPPPAYPVGKTKGQNAKVTGRLFDIDGKVEYFAGSYLFFKSSQTSHSRDRILGTQYSNSCLQT